MRALFIILCFLYSLSLSGATINLDGLELDIPDEYGPMEDEGKLYYVRVGDGPSLLKDHLLEEEFDESFLNDWFVNNVIAYLRITTLPKDSNITSIDILTDKLKQQWGAHSFTCSFESENVVQFINIAGAFVSLSFLSVDEQILIVESMDLVQTLVAENTPIPDNQLEQCEHFNKASNMEDVLSIFQSLRIHNNS